MIEEYKLQKKIEYEFSNKTVNLSAILSLMSIFIIRFKKNIYALRYLNKVATQIKSLSAFVEILKNNAAQFPNWQVNNFGLGIKDETALMNISANTESSSILDINETHIEIAPNAVFVGKEQIILKQLDSIFSEISKLHKNIFLKIDTQGFEYNVLEGALKSLPYIKGIELEMSFVPLYKDEKTFAEMHDYITNKGFQLALIEPQIHQADTGALIQADCVFVQKNNKTS
mgnify:CR=1 FL=1